MSSGFGLERNGDLLGYRAAAERHWGTDEWKIEAMRRSKKFGGDLGRSGGGVVSVEVVSGGWEARVARPVVVEAVGGEFNIAWVIGSRLVGSHEELAVMVGACVEEGRKITAGSHIYLPVIAAWRLN